MIAADLLAILCCPEDRQPLGEADAGTLARLNARVAARSLVNRGGAPVREPLAAGLVRRDGAVFYPILDDIPILLVDEGIFL